MKSLMTETSRATSGSKEKSGALCGQIECSRPGETGVLRTPLVIRRKRDAECLSVQTSVALVDHEHLSRQLSSGRRLYLH